VAVLGLIIILAVVALALLAPLIVPADPYAINPRASMEAPSAAHPLGTDRLGRDLAARLIYGARISLWVGVVSVGLATLVGLPLGVLAGYYGGLIDDVLMRLMDILFAFPPILLAIVVAAVLGPGLTNAMIAIGIIYLPRLSRVARGPVLALRQMEFVEAARALGATHLRIMLTHILPNILGIMLVQITLNLSTAILAEAALSFLGLGAQPPTPTWGGILNEGRLFMQIAPWLSLYPGLAISITVLGFNLLGDGLRDVLDPRLRNT
jgi:peptide/nickel transport system permease protein